MKGERIPISEDRVAEAVKLLSSKIQDRLDEKGSHSYASSHECLGIIAEEYHELVESVRSNRLDDFEKECLDLAVACVFAIACKRAGALDW